MKFFIPTYSEFIRENIETKNVVLFPGRFMPIHLGHLNGMKKAYEVFGNVSVLPIQIIRESSKSPFSENILNKIGRDVLEDNFFLAEWIIYPKEMNTSLLNIIECVKKINYNPIGLACGSDRYENYKSQNDRYKMQMLIESIEDKNEKSISSTDIRNAMIEDNFDFFKKMTPSVLWNYYDDMKSQLT